MAESCGSLLNKTPEGQVLQAGDLKGTVKQNVEDGDSSQAVSRDGARVGSSCQDRPHLQAVSPGQIPVTSVLERSLKAAWAPHTIYHKNHHSGVISVTHHSCPVAGSGRVVPLCKCSVSVYS